MSYERKRAKMFMWRNKNAMNVNVFCHLTHLFKTAGMLQQPTAVVRMLVIYITIAPYRPSVRSGTHSRHCRFLTFFQRLRATVGIRHAGCVQLPETTDNRKPINVRLTNVNVSDVLRT